MVAKHGGIYRVRGGELNVVEDDLWSPTRIVIVEFPDIELPGGDLPNAATDLPGDNLRGGQLSDRLPGIDDVDTSNLERPATPVGPS